MEQEWWGNGQFVEAEAQLEDLKVREVAYNSSYCRKLQFTAVQLRPKALSTWHTMAQAQSLSSRLSSQLSLVCFHLLLYQNNRQI
jgi:hypothetical protein